jgi:hypothetical protein
MSTSLYHNFLAKHILKTFLGVKNSYKIYVWVTLENDIFEQYSLKYHCG